MAYIILNLKPTNRLIILYATAVISAVYIASQSAYWQIVLCAVGIAYLALIIKYPKNMGIYIIIPLFLFSAYRTNLDITRHQRMQEFTQKEEINITGRVIDLSGSFCVIQAESIDKVLVKGRAKIWNEDGFEVEVGDKIIANISPQPDTKAKFYGDFDYIKQNLSLHQYIFGFNKSYKITKKSNSVMKIVYNFRQNIKERFDMLFPKNEANTAKALLLGDMSEVDAETKQEIKDSGASHIFAVSGQHLSIISLGLMFLLGIICKGSKTKNIIAIFVIIIYSVLVGYSASVLRSAIMIIKYLSAFLINRRDDPIDSVFFSAIIVVLLFPFSIFTPNFLLSYVAILGILLLSGPFSKVKIKYYKIVTMIFASLSAIIASSIFMAYFFKQINLTSIWSSAILDVPITLALFGILLIAFFPFLSGVLANVTYLLLHLTNVLISKMADTKVVISTGTPVFIIFVCFGFIIFFLHVIIEKGIVPWLNNRLRES